MCEYDALSWVPPHSCHPPAGFWGSWDPTMGPTVVFLFGSPLWEAQEIIRLNEPSAQC